VAADAESRQTRRVTALPEPPRLRAVDDTDRDPLEREGLALAYAALEHTLARAALDRLTVAIDDAALGRQLLTAPRTELPGPLDADADWSATPPLEGDAIDMDLLRALCRLALRGAVQDETAGEFDLAELALRDVEGVEAVATDPTHDVVRVQAPASPGGDAVARAALDVIRGRFDRSVVVEVVRHDAGLPAGARAPISWVPTSPFELLAVRADQELGELEVHLGDGDVRTVGRAPLRDGIIGAAHAALDAWHRRPGAPARSVGWARTVEAAAETRVVVAVALEDAGHITVAHGIGEGTNSFEAAARATVDALSR
jgi:hypothetical protein